jgi:hypothetical protein
MERSAMATADKFKNEMENGVLASIHAPHENIDSIRSMVIHPADECTFPECVWAYVAWNAVFAIRVFRGSSPFPK